MSMVVQHDVQINMSSYTMQIFQKLVVCFSPKKKIQAWLLYIVFPHIPKGNGNMFKKKEEKNLCLSWGCHGGSGSIVIESFFLQAKTNNKLLKNLHGITRHIYLNIVLDHRHGKIWVVKIEHYWFSRFAISIPYQTNSLSLSETLETSMPILGLKACMQLHKGRKCNMYIRRQSCKLLIK